jgi:hypothetical protein
MALDPKAPAVPFGILLYGTKLLISDEASFGSDPPFPVEDGSIKVFDTRKGIFLPPLDSTGYSNSNAKGFHPFGMVVGPDGYLYVTNRCLQPTFGNVVQPCDLTNASRGDVIRFDLNTNKFLDVFVSGEMCLCLDRPSGVVFGPDQRLYVANTILPALFPPDTDNIVIFSGANKVDTIELDGPKVDNMPPVRNQPPSLRFGPGGLLYVEIVQNIIGSDGKYFQNTGAVRRCSVTTKQCVDIVRPNTTLQRPDGLTFGRTNPTTLVYENNDQNNN